MTTLSDLTERLEKATGADRELDAMLYELHPEWKTAPHPYRYVPGETGGIPPYTASIDAALALVERVLPGAALEECSYWPKLVHGEEPNNRHANVKLLALDEAGFGDPKRRYRASASTLPLAILIALLRARSHTESQT